MTSRLLLAVCIAALLVVCADDTSAQTAVAPPASAVTIPPNTCAKPDYPGKLASVNRFNAFKKEYDAYGACIKRYVEQTNVIVTAASAAVGDAIADYNKWTAEIKAKEEAANN